MLDVIVELVVVLVCEGKLCLRFIVFVVNVNFLFWIVCCVVLVVLVVVRVVVLFWVVCIFVKCFDVGEIFIDVCWCWVMVCCVVVVVCILLFVFVVVFVW